MEAIILVGGFGTRLRKLVQDVPKPMADINGKPFLEHILNYLIHFGMRKVFLSVGYKYEVIENYFGSSYKALSIQYIVEKSPLGTGGAIKEAIKHCSEKNVLVLNGDSFFHLDLTAFMEKHNQLQTSITMALKPMENFDRYGFVEIKGDKVMAFKEKVFKSFAYINAGVYLMQKDIFQSYDLTESFSIEIDFFQKHIDTLKIGAYSEDAYFIDIGIPEDYIRAQKEILNHIQI